jgi:F0F1-type ATP synthase gamma subunit
LAIIFSFGRHHTDEIPIQKELMILITSEGSFSGDIDQRLIKEAMKNYNPAKNDIIVIGHHGAVQLAQNGITYKRSFKTPQQDTNINVTPLTQEAQHYIEKNYIFEPNTYAVVSHLERSMMQISLSEVILESKLAQYASRFKAMSLAKDRANETLGDVSLMFNRAKRHEKDERLKEVLNGLRKAEA